MLRIIMELNLIKSISLTLLMFSLASCSLTPGVSAGKLPIDGTFTANNGVTFTVTEVNANNIPTITTAPKTPISLPINQRFSAPSYDYVIATGDIIAINLPNYPELTQNSQGGQNGSSLYGSGFLVDQSGYLQFPMIGRIKASGLTTNQLTNVLSSKLSRYLRQPDPQVRVLSYRGNKFYVDGEVKSPGQFVIADQPVTLYSALGLAGGTTTTSDTENITLTRDGRTYRFGLKSMQDSGYSANNLLIKNNDVIHVSNNTQKRVTVIGEFGTPKPIQIPEDGISLAAVIGEASGLNGASADARKVYILRENPSQNVADIYHVDLTTLTNFSVANRFKMQSGDVVYVDPTGLARWNRVINLLLPATAISNAARQF